MNKSLRPKNTAMVHLLDSPGAFALAGHQSDQGVDVEGPSAKAAGFLATADVDDFFAAENDPKIIPFETLYFGHFAHPFHI